VGARNVEIVITNSIVDNYEARSFPDEQDDSMGYYPLYKVPVYKVRITGTNASHKTVSSEFQATRFMPYFNDPGNPDPRYKTLGWVNSGLSSARKISVSRYLPHYELHNRLSPARGAIVLKDYFYIHAGPPSLSEVGWGSAGCVEVIGNFDNFKKAIVKLSGLKEATDDIALQKLVKAGKLTVTIQGAKVPDIKSKYTRRIHD